MNPNLLMKLALEELSKGDAAELREIIRETIKGNQSGVANTAELYFQVEPFAREFNEFKEDPKHYGYSPEGRWINTAIGFIGGSGGVKKYRAMMFAWLSYYHPDVAEEFCKKIGIEIPFYQGDPYLSSCSDEAKALFVKRKVIDSVSKPDPSDTADDTQSDQLTEIQHDDPEPKVEETPEVETDKPTRDKRSKAAVIVIALIGTVGAFAAAITYTQSTSDERSSTLATGDNLGTLNPADGNEQTSLSPNEEEAGKAEPEKSDETEKEPEPPAPIKRDPINPVWDKVSGGEWSTKVLEYFYPYVRRSNKQDLLSTASQGNANAQTLAGIGYHKGLLGQTDHGLELRKYLQPACKSGQARACTLIGVHYRFGWGYPANNATAASFYGKGCRLGNLQGCHYLAVRYQRGEGVPQNLPRAMQEYDRLCVQGVGFSCLQLAIAYGGGNGVPIDLQKSRTLYDRARTLVAPISYRPYHEAFRTVTE